MTTLHEVLEQAQRRAVAIGHFNVSDLVALRAILEAARDLNAPVMVGVSEGERAFMGVRQVAALVKSIRDEYEYPIFLNRHDDCSHQYGDPFGMAPGPRGRPRQRS